MNREIEEFKRALIFDAKVCDWETFEGKAGMLFDYLESIELSEIQKIFSRIIRITAAILLLAGSALWIMSNGTNQEMVQHYESYLIVLVLGGLCFLVLFFIDYKIVTGFKASRRSGRRDRFVRNIEDDFRSRLGNAVCARTEKQGDFLNA